MSPVSQNPEPRRDLVAETLAKQPTPPSTPLEALDHVLAIYSESPDEMAVLQATTNIYPDARWTGLRLGDLRRIRGAVLAEVADELHRRTLLADDCACVSVLRADAADLAAAADAAESARTAQSGGAS